MIFVTEVEKRLGREILTPVDVALISILKQKRLKPESKGEFFELLKVLDKDEYIYEFLAKEMNKIEPSITEYYKQYPEDKLILVIKNI